MKYILQYFIAVRDHIVAVRTFMHMHMYVRERVKAADPFMTIYNCIIILSDVLSHMRTLNVCLSIIHIVCCSL